MFERITRREEADLVIAWMAISISFAIIFLRSIGRADIFTALLFFGISLLTVGIGFVLHEMAHKYVAIHYGFWAEFRVSSFHRIGGLAHPDSCGKADVSRPGVG